MFGGNILERRWGGKGKISKAFKGTGREVREGGEKKKGEGRGGEGRRGEIHGQKILPAEQGFWPPF